MNKSIQLVIFASILAVNVAFAAATPVPADHDPILMWVIGGLCTLLFSISAYVLSKVDRNQNRLFERQDEFSERLVKVETTQDNCGNCP